MSKSYVPQIIAMLAAIVAIVAFFFPFISATEEYAQYIDSRATERVYPSTNITIGDMKYMSLYEYARVYYEARQDIFHDDASGVFYAAFIGSIALFAFLAFLFAWVKRPVLLLLNGLLIGGAFYAINWDFADRRIMPDSNRVWGISHKLIYPVAAILIVCAIWMFIAKRIEKKSV